MQIPFVAQLYTSAYDWLKQSGAPTEQEITDILTATGFTGKILEYDAGNNSLLIENHGNLTAGLATDLTVYLSCTPLRGHESNCPQQMELQLPAPKGSDASSKTLQAHMVTDDSSKGAEAQETVKYALRLPTKLDKN